LKGIRPTPLANIEMLLANDADASSASHSGNLQGVRKAHDECKEV
jgi:hypothetical protein